MTDDPLTYLFSLEQFGIKFGLDNIRTIVEALGRPHDSFDSVHIAGTNGKGSVSAMVESMLRAAGIRTGRYTSPHLVHLTERFAIDGRAVEEPALRAATSEVRDAVVALQHDGRLDVHPTFFEVTTAAAFLLFRRAGVDIAVCEVGLGGRLDATNVLSPMATAITSIGVDHQQYLGTTLTEIAAEKAGIIKPGVPVVIGNMDRGAEAVILRVADDRQATAIRAGDGVDVHIEPRSAKGAQRIRVRTPARDYGMIELGLDGAHQVDNAIVAIRLIETMQSAGRAIGADAVRSGLARVEWPGRLQRIVRADGRVLLLDAAHNPDGARTLARHLRERAPRPLVFAAMRDKDALGILRELNGTISAIVLTRASHPRSAEPAALVDIATRALGDIPHAVAEQPADALEIAWRFGPEIVVAGSIFLLGDVMKQLGPS